MLIPGDLKEGQEQYEKFYSFTVKKELMQYDYRHIDGELFSCIKPSLEGCRAERDNWIKHKESIQKNA